MRKFLFIFSFLSIFFISAGPALAACSWEKLSVTYTYGSIGMPSSSTKTGGCSAKYLSDAADSACSTTVKPTYTTASGNTAVCCCAPDSGASTEKQAIFIPPDLQVQIPGMEKLSTISCDESGQCEIPWLGQYVIGIYNYALSIVGILAAIMLMAGGLLWLVSAGDASKITQAKELITGSVTGLIILAASFIILIQINPNLVKFGTLDLSIVKRYDITPAPENTTVFSSNCTAQATGPCAVSNMSIFGDRASQASAICNAESGGNPSISNKLTRCTGGEYAVWGLFQFNLSDNDFVDASGTVLHCSKAFNHRWTNKNPTCTVIDAQLYNKCVAAAITPSLSISNAKRLTGASKTFWGPWEANAKWCHF